MSLLLGKENTMASENWKITSWIDDKGFQQEMPINIFYRRLMEKNRKEIAADAKKINCCVSCGQIKTAANSGNNIGIA